MNTKRLIVMLIVALALVGCKPDSDKRRDMNINADMQRAAAKGGW